MEKIHLKIKRQDGGGGLSYWEEFRVPYRPGMNVIVALRAIQDDPVTADGLPTTPVVWEGSCLEEVCGSCAMVINGRVRQACTTMVDDISGTIVLEPMESFPVVRDLKVDRSSLFESLSTIRAWHDIDGLHDREPTCGIAPDEAGRLQLLASCIMCGSCVEACPQVNDRSPYAGAYLVAYALLMNERQPADAGVRLEALKGPGGIAECSNAQNCASVCPRGIPLAEVIPRMRWQVFKHSVRSFLFG